MSRKKSAPKASEETAPNSGDVGKPESYVQNKKGTGPQAGGALAGAGGSKIGNKGKAATQSAATPRKNAPKKGGIKGAGGTKMGKGARAAQSAATPRKNAPKKGGIKGAGGSKMGNQGTAAAQSAATPRKNVPKKGGIKGGGGTKMGKGTAKSSATPRKISRKK